VTAEFSAATARAHGLAARRALPPRARRRASASICAAVIRSRWFQHALRIAIYMPMEDEVDLRPLIGIAERCGKSVYAPVINAAAQMQFVAVTTASTLIENRFGIAEPQASKRHGAATIARPKLHVVCAPLSAFDKQCHRAGLGGGYYDRYFEDRHSTHSTRLIGVAFDVQRVARIDTRDWDVPMDAIVSERRIYRPQTLCADVAPAG
jgi:5-formyltetrahydrofolate cyclo-ligase